MPGVAAARPEAPPMSGNARPPAKSGPRGRVRRRGDGERTASRGWPAVPLCG